MRYYQKPLYVLCLLFVFKVSVLVSQEIEPKMSINIDDLGNVSDKFQESFFEALKQKAINNPEKAITALQTCIDLNSQPNVLYLELGKNYLSLKNYDKAEENFLKVQKEKPDDRHVLELLFEVYFSLRKYKESVVVLEKLVVHSPMFKEQLANIYFLEERYDDALSVLDELTQAYGSDRYREKLRKRILGKVKNNSPQIAKLKKKIEENPKNEQNYLNLIYVYSQNNQQDKAYEIAQELVKKKPKSELVHLALYKFYLDDNKVDQAIKSMKIALKSNAVNDESKFKMVADFLPFIKENPQYESQLSDIMKEALKSENNAKTYTALGNYYYDKGEREKALNYYERGIKDNASDFELMKRMVALQLDLQRYEKVISSSELGMEMYPSQPIFYFVNGVSLIQLNKADKAIDILSTGIDYVLDNPSMEVNFYQQLSTAYEMIGDSTKAIKYKEKAVQLQKNQNG